MTISDAMKAIAADLQKLADQIDTEIENLSSRLDAVSAKVDDMPLLLTSLGYPILINGSPATPAPPPVATGEWYDAVFAMRDGTGVGSRSSSPTAGSSWASATSGVSLSSGVITVTAASLSASGIDISNNRLIWSGNNGTLTDFEGLGATGGSGIWLMSGDNMVLDYLTIDNSGSPVNAGPMLYFNATTANGTHYVKHGWFKNTADDVVKGPNNGVMHIEDCFFDGYRLYSAEHVDFVDMKASGAGSSIKRCLFLGKFDQTSPTNASQASTGLNAMIRCVASDAHGYDGSDRTYENCIFVGSDDIYAGSTLLSFTSATATGVSMYDCLYDLREHNNLLDSIVRVEDWYVRSFDYAASVAAGVVTGVSAAVPFPNLAAQPAAVPSTMNAPVLTGGVGKVSWAEVTRPWNQRSLITQYDLRWSTNGTVWNIVTDIQRTASELTGLSAGSGYRIQMRAVNSVGAGAWSATSNIVTVS